MRKFFLLLILMFSISFTYGQEQEKLKTYKVMVKKMDGTRVRGYFIKADNNGVTVDVSKRFEEDGLVVIAAEDIVKIKLRRKASITRGALTGLAIGTAVGGLAGYAAGDDSGGFVSFSKEEKAVILGTAFGFFGTVIGTVIGTSRKKFYIYGSNDNYRKELPILQQYNLLQD